MHQYIPKYISVKRHIHRDLQNSYSFGKIQNVGERFHTLFFIFNTLPLVCGEKALMGVDIWNLHKSMTLLPFLFSFLIINFHNFCYIFTLHHCSVICWDFILRITCLDKYIKFLFVSVIMLFVYDSDRYGTAARSGWELFMTTIYGFQLLLFIIGGFVWDVLAVPDLPLPLYFYSVNNTMICSKVSFS